MFFPHHLFLSFTKADKSQYFGAWQFVIPEGTWHASEVEVCIEMTFLFHRGCQGDGREHTSLFFEIRNQTEFLKKAWLSKKEEPACVGIRIINV